MSARRVPFADYLSFIQNVRAIHDLEERFNIVLDDEDGSMVPLVDLLYFQENLFHNLRREAERRLDVAGSYF